MEEMDEECGQVPLYSVPVGKKKKGEDGTEEKPTSK